MGLIVFLYAMCAVLKIDRQVVLGGTNKNDHRSGGAVKEGCPYLCIKHIIKLKKKKNCILICVNCAIRRIKGLSSIVNWISVVTAQ